MKLELRFLSALTLVAGLGLTGCPADDDPMETGEEGSTGEMTAGETGTTTGTTAASMTTVDPTEDPTMTSTSTTTTTTDTTSTDTTTTDSTTTTTTDVDPQPDGAACMADAECESEMCFLAGILGGICGECLTEDDCEFGCSLPNPLADPPTGAACNTGELGDGCETEASCADDTHLCALILDVPGILTAATCSECETTADCDVDGQVCNVAVDISTISGQKTCVDPGTVADADFCDLEGDGDAACMNHCGEANIMGLVSFGVCGECRNEGGMAEGCADGETCVDPMVDLDGNVIASECV